MRRWHDEQPLMERRRNEDLAEHRRHNVMIGKDPDEFECVCKEGIGFFRKKKQYECSCRMCRFIAYMRKLKPSIRDYRRGVSETCESYY